MPANNEISKNIGLLDEIRLKNGIDKLKTAFHYMAGSDIERAIFAINDEYIQFPSLFVLRSEIKKFDLSVRLNMRNKYVMKITDEILTGNISEMKLLSSDFKGKTYSALKWMLETGYTDDGLNDQYDEVIETAAIILAKVYKEKAFLYPVEDMIFSRHRKGFYIYDLVWAFFEASAPENLTRLINRLLSPNRKDVELAKKLLNFIPYMETGTRKEPVEQYQYSLKWLSQNRDFLYYTGESFLQTGNPYRYAVSLESKYLQKAIPGSNGEISRALTEEEHILLDTFKRLDDNSKLLLSDCSSILYRENKYRWSKWLRYPIMRQIETAKRMSGGLQ